MSISASSRSVITMEHLAETFARFSVSSSLPIERQVEELLKLFASLKVSRKRKGKRERWKGMNPSPPDPS